MFRKSKPLLHRPPPMLSKPRNSGLFIFMLRTCRYKSTPPPHELGLWRCRRLRFHGDDAAEQDSRIGISAPADGGRAVLINHREDQRLLLRLQAVDVLLQLGEALGPLG